MNAYENLNRNALLVMKDLLIELRDWNASKMANAENETNKSNYKQMISEYNHIVVDIYEAIHSGKTLKNKHTIDGYEMLPESDLDILVKAFHTARARAKAKIEADQFATLHDKEMVARIMHRRNPIHEFLRIALKRKHKQTLKGRHIGETAFASDGKTVLTLVDWKNDNNVSVKFPDGRVINLVRYDKFRKGRIHPKQAQYFPTHMR